MKEKRNTPEIRFAGFTEKWEETELGKLCESFDYGLNAAATKYDGANKYIRITDIDDESRIFSENDLTSPATDLTLAENYRLTERDILFARTGASVGKTYIYRKADGLVYFAGFLIRARINANTSADFVFQNTLTRSHLKYKLLTSTFCLYC